MKYKSASTARSTVRPVKSELNPEDLSPLTCWKEIAQYLGKGVRTVQRWEQDLGLPVRRPTGVDHKSAVIAYRRDLDAWLESRWSKRNGTGKTPQPDLVPSRPPLNQLIAASQRLRSTHSLLLEETTIALETLVESCNELILARQCHATESKTE